MGNQINQTVVMNSDIKVTDLKIEENKAAMENAYGDSYYYYVTGNLTNTSSLDAAEIEFELIATPHSIDSYGDDVAEDPLDQYFESLTPGVIGNSFFDVKAGETRPFTFAINYGRKLTDPEIVITDTYVHYYSLYADEKVAFGDQFSVTQEKGNDTQAVYAIKNNTGKAIDSATVRFSYVTEEGEPATSTVDAAFLADLDRIFAFEKAYGDHDFKILDIVYSEDAEALSANFADLFEAEMGTEGNATVCKLTNNTGKYLSRASVRYMYKDEEGSILFETAYYANMKPGATATEQLQDGTDHQLIYAEYDVDEDKETAVASQGKTDDE